MKIYPSHHLCSLHRTIATQRKRCCARPLLSSYYSHSQRPSGELPTPKESETKTQSKPSSSNESPESSSPQASKDSTSPDPPPSPKNSTTDRDFIPIQPSSSQREITRLNQDHQQFAPPPPSATRFQKDLHSLIETFVSLLPINISGLDCLMFSPIEIRMEGCQSPPGSSPPTGR